MKMEELQQSWNDMNNNMENKPVDHFTEFSYRDQQRIQSPVQKITGAEKAGMLVCVAAAAIVAANFDKMDTLIFKVIAVVSIILLLMIPVISFVSTYRLNMPADMLKPYADTLKDFASAKLTFFRLQKLAIFLSYLLFVNTILLLPKIFGGKDITAYKYFWICALPVGYIFFYFFSVWVNKKYRYAIAKAEELLRELGPERSAGR